MNEELIERLKIRELIENWALWRDANDWDRFRTVWAPEGRMMATWTQGTFEEFIGMSQAGFAKGVRILHFLGGSTIEVNGSRAVALTKMTISQRGKVHDVLCDVVCTGRFCDFLRKKDDGNWGLSLRQPIYEKDRIDPVDPAARLELEPERLARFPEGYRHLAYLQSLIGYPVKTDMPGLTGPEVEALYARCRAWLSGESKTAEARV
jgi:SnoaL-like domain